MDSDRYNVKIEKIAKRLQKNLHRGEKGSNFATAIGKRRGHSNESPAQ